MLSILVLQQVGFIPWFFFIMASIWQDEISGYLKIEKALKEDVKEEMGRISKVTMSLIHSLC